MDPTAIFVRLSTAINNIYILTNDKLDIRYGYMKKGSTLFLKVVIALLALLTLGVCVIILGVTLSGNAGQGLPIMIGVFLTAIPFLYALYQGVLLLSYIEKNTAFSTASVKAVATIEYCAFAISTLYALMMPFIIRLAEADDAPGAVLIGLLFIAAPFVTGVFAAVLQRVLQNGLDLKSENDLTV